MSDFQKVRVTFTDADGKQVSAAMRQLSEFATAAYFKPDHDRVLGCLTWDESDDVTVTPIRELPTGVGAVIRVSDYRSASYVTGYEDADTWVRAGEYWANGPGETEHDSAVSRWEYEVLSEGIQL